MSKTVLVTFAGRRDRMQLLTRYVDAAISAGLIDEWHVWDFTRTAADAAWLRRLFAHVQVTPSHTNEYFRHPDQVAFSGEQLDIPVRVRAPSNIHIGLRRLSGEGRSFEIVLGGWQNTISATRAFETGDDLLDLANRETAELTTAIRTPDLLPEFECSDIKLRLSGKGLQVLFRDTLLLDMAEDIGPGSFEILFRTGYSANGEWHWPSLSSAPARLFVAGPELHYAPDAMFYTRAYQFYGARADVYRDDVFLKCDDDIVHFDLTRLSEFISFRRNNRDYFLVSANVINNGVCAYFQQQSGQIPADLMDCELPPGGMCGSLWSEGAKAQALHHFFLDDPERFRTATPEIVWNERISINFIAWLGEDLGVIPDIMSDDEHDLCYGIRKRARKSNCIYIPFVVSHLSFWKQDADMNLAELLARYETLADSDISTFIAGCRHMLPAQGIPRHLAIAI